MKNLALILAGGSGVRMHQDIPKQFLKVNGKPIIAYTMEAFQRAPEIDVIAVVCLAGWEKVLLSYAEQYHISKLQHVIPGGETGQSSIRNGIFCLEKQYEADDIVLIHDAIRPMVSVDVIDDCIKVTQQYGSAIASVPCVEAMMLTGDGQISCESYPRDKLRRTQTPQGVRLGRLCELHRKAMAQGITNSVASCTLMVEMGEKVHFSAGAEKNIKLTTMEDVDIFKALLLASNEQSD